MPRSCITVGAWDLATYGTCTLNWTDDGGAQSTTIDPAVYDHDGLTSASGLTGVADSLGDIVEAMMNAEASDVFAVTFDRATGLYTIENTVGSVFSIAWTGAAGERLRSLLGFVADCTGALSYTSTHVPLYAMAPRGGSMADYPHPFQEKGHVITRRSSGARPYRNSPVAIPWLTSFMFEFQPKSHIDRAYRDALADSVDHLYTWEQLWADYGRSARYPLTLHTEGADGFIEIFSFDLATPEYDETTHKRRVKNDDVRHTVMISALLCQQTADPTLPARTVGGGDGARTTSSGAIRTTSDGSIRTLSA